ncbi:MAG: OmpH family outer membrane protein [Acidobacteriota bacterium]|nr:OmpH family outer membrane protein [Acidobacteriota bacterium]
MTKNLFAMLALGAGMAGMAMAQAAAPAAAQTAPPATASPTAAPATLAGPPTKVGVIQIQAALAATKEGQKAAAELEVKMAPRKKELEGKQSEIKDLQDRLAKGGNTLSDSAKEDLTRNIDAKTKSYNRQLEDAQAELEQEQQKLVNVLGQKMMAVIDKFAQQNGFAIVLDVSNQNTPVLYASNTVDITKEVIDLYDKTVFTATPAASRPAPTVSRPAAAPAPKPAPAAPAAAPAKKP